jgi:hypothetical protein
MVQPAEKSKFEFRDKLESWIEGLFDTIAVYLRTFFLFNLRPFKSAIIVQAEASDNVTLTQPGIFLVISYFLMALLIKDVDFSDPVFAFNLAKLLDVLGALEAAKSLDAEKVILGIFPAIGLLFFFCYLSSGILKVFGERIDPVLLRRRYSYVLGEMFLLVGIVCGGYLYFVKPLSAKSWWLGLSVHVLTMAPLMGVIMLSLCPLPGETKSTKGTIGRFIARNIPWTCLIFAIWYLTGSWGLLNYLKAK